MASLEDAAPIGSSTSELPAQDESAVEPVALTPEVEPSRATPRANPQTSTVATTKVPTSKPTPHDKGKAKAPDPEEERKARSQAEAQQQLKKIREEKAERERVLKQVKQDQADRRKREREKARKPPTSDTTNSEQSAKPHTRRPPPPTNEIRIQVRLFDGTSIRSTFTTTQTIHSDVRPWIDSQRPDGNTPYTLKQILTPQPSRSITLSEEGESLENLGIGRTANLVMVPVRTYTEAYASAAPGLAVRGASAGINLVRGTVGTVFGAVGSMLGFGQVTASDNTLGGRTTAGSGSGEENDAERKSGGSGGINIRTLHDQQDEQRDQQFYNGNQVCLGHDEYA